MLKFPLKRSLSPRDKAVILDWRVLVLPLAHTHLAKEVTARSQGWAYRRHPRLNMASPTLVTKKRRAKAEELGAARRGQIRKSGGSVAGTGRVGRSVWTKRVKVGSNGKSPTCRGNRK